VLKEEREESEVERAIRREGERRRARPERRLPRRPGEAARDGARLANYPGGRTAGVITDLGMPNEDGIDGEQEDRVRVVVGQRIGLRRQREGARGLLSVVAMAVAAAPVVMVAVARVSVAR
jgi:hypothetical protein